MSIFLTGDFFKVNSIIVEMCVTWYHNHRNRRSLMERILPVGVQSFGEIRTRGMVYVDKTEYVWRLVNSLNSCFLSRPRRFGKSLLTSTLECYFLGKKELFKGLYIDRQENAWTEYPVVAFYLSGGEFKEPNGLSDMLQHTIEQAARKYDVTVNGQTLAVRFKSLIENLRDKTGRQVVVLVDEYDKPLLDTMISDPEQEINNRDLYKGFFSVLKDMDDYLRFVFFTGVTKFTQVSVFSDLNQLIDISLNDEYSGLCGITEKELVDCFDPDIHIMADKYSLSYDECLDRLREMYDGYHFSGEGVGVYNPFSLLSAFTNQRLSRYWYRTGTPTILMKKLNDSSISLSQITDGVDADEDELQDYRVDDDDPIPLFYQTGYLTICGYDREFNLYSLKFPNNEVKYGFFNSLIPGVLGSANKENPTSLRRMLVDLRKGDIPSFINRIKSLFGAIPYPEGKAPEYEGEWARQIFLVLSLMGAYTQCEVHMSTGRADCVVKTDDYIYVFEFKLDKSVDEALEQIESKDYTIPYAADGRKLFKVGVNFSSEKRNIADYRVG